MYPSTWDEDEDGNGIATFKIKGKTFVLNLGTFDDCLRIGQMLAEAYREGMRHTSDTLLAKMDTTKERGRRP